MVCGPEATYLLGCWRHKEKHAKFLLISCGCVFLYTNMCKHSGDGVSTWAMFDGHIKMQKYLLYYGSAFVVIYSKHCVITF